jgi:hypothetical protein
MNHLFEPRLAEPLARFTPNQGPLSKPIHWCSVAHLGALTYIAAFASPSVHQMLLTLERGGLIRRQKGGARRIQVLVNPPTCHSYQSKSLRRNTSPTKGGPAAAMHRVKCPRCT